MTPSADLPLGPLNPGNVVSAGLKLYRDRFKTFLRLSIQAYLWLFVPVYGWAKYFMLTGLMARLAFQQLIQQPESVVDGKRHVRPKLWSFFGLGVLMLLIFVAVYFALGLVAAGFGLVGGLILVGVTSPFLGSDIGAGLGIFLGILIFIGVFLFGLIWVIARLLIAEVPLAIESDVTASKSISRSWQLTQLSFFRIQFVVLAAFLITLPVLLLSNTVPQLALSTVAYESTAYWVIYISGLVLSVAGSILVLPFWQTVKGVLYYDLRSRREGIDLQA